MSTEALENPVAERFGYILKRAQQSLRARMDLELRAHSLTTPQYAVLVWVANSPGISNADLAKAAFVTPQTMQGIIATLEKRGLLSRSPDPNHGRRLMAQLTENGQSLLKEADATVMKVQTMMIGGIPASQVEIATDTLLACIKNLSEK